MQKYGNGTATESEKKDVYMLEKDTEENGKVIYEIKYYEKSTGDSEVLGELVDTVKETTDEITFNISKFLISEDGSASNFIHVNINKGFKARNGMTWREWVNSSYGDVFITDFNDAFESEGCKIGDKNENIRSDAVMAWLFRNESSLGNGNANIVFVSGNEALSSRLKLDDVIDTTNNYFLHSIRGAECVYPDSNILINRDGKTTLANNIKENDEIIYFDFVENIMKKGKVSKVYVHKDATNFVRYTFEDGSYLEATDYHPIYTKEGWKSQTQRNGYEIPKIGDEVKTPTGWKVITKIETWQGLEDCYDFEIVTEEEERVNNYFANGTLVQGSY